MAWFSFHGGHSGQFCPHAEGELAAVLESFVSEALLLDFSDVEIRQAVDRKLNNKNGSKT